MPPATHRLPEQPVDGQKVATGDLDSRRLAGCACDCCPPNWNHAGRNLEMRLGLFADVHDHLDNLRRVVEIFNERACETVLFAGDLVSTFAVPPLRKLRCPFVGCYGDNEGNKPGLQAGFSIIGTLSEAPVLWTSPEGLRFAIVHMERQLRLLPQGTTFDIALCGHTHKPSIRTDEQGRLWLNPGEVSGWTFGRPTVMTFDTTTRTAEIVPLYDAPSPGGVS